MAPYKKVGSDGSTKKYGREPHGAMGPVPTKRSLFLSLVYNIISIL